MQLWQHEQMRFWFRKGGLLPLSPAPFGYETGKLPFLPDWFPQNCIRRDGANARCADVSLSQTRNLQ